MTTLLTGPGTRAAIERYFVDIGTRREDSLSDMLEAKPDVQERLSQLGLEWKANTSGELAAFLREEVQKWSKAVRDSGARAD